MAEAKYRPSFTLAELRELLKVAEDMLNCANFTVSADLDNAIKILKLTLLKADMNLIQPSHIATGVKTGRPSALDMVREPVKSITKEEAQTQADMYQRLGQPVPQHIQEILNRED